MIHTIAHDLGLRPFGRSALSPCPACWAKQRSRTDRKRGPIGIKPPTGWKCWACGTTGDVLDLVALVLTDGSSKAKGRGYHLAREWMADRQLMPELEAAKAAPPPPPKRPPQDEVIRLLRQAVPVSDHAEGRRTLQRLGIDPDRAPAGILPPTAAGSFWPANFSRNWPLVVPAFEADGTLASLHGRALSASPARPNRPETWPIGFDSGRLFFADPTHARPFLRGGPPPGRLAIVEGLSDYLAACCALPNRAVLGIASGSAPAFSDLEPRLSRTRVYTLTDADDAGDAYHRRICAAMPSVPVRRIRPALPAGACP